MASFFPDYKYFDLIKPMPGMASRSAPVKLCCPCLDGVHNAWKQNIWRTNSFCLFPAEVAASAFQKQLWRDYAIFKVTKKLALKERHFNEKTEKTISREIEKCKKKWKKEFFSSGMEAANKRRMTLGVDYINRMLGSEFGAMQSMEAILFSVVVESWMAFEVLVGDLFFKALDHGHPEWRINVQAKYKDFEGGSNWEPSVPATIRSDPQKAFGSSLRDHNAISFRKFRYMPLWYKTAFGADAEKLFKTVDGGYIRALAAVRNVIAHKAGIADATYISEIQKFPELKRRSVEKKLIPLDGEIVRKLRTAAINLGNELVIYIDEALPASERTR